MRGEAGEAGGEGTWDWNDSNHSKKKKSPLLLISLAKLSSCSLPFVYWKGWVWCSVPFPRFTELLEGVAAAETCPGGEKKNALNTGRKCENWLCLSSFVNIVFLIFLCECCIVYIKYSRVLIKSMEASLFKYIIKLCEVGDSRVKKNHLIMKKSESSQLQLPLPKS